VQLGKRKHPSSEEQSSEEDKEDKKEESSSSEEDKDSSEAEASSGAALNSKRFRKNEKNPDYFSCPAAIDLIKEAGSKTFKDKDHFRSSLLDKVNDEHGEKEIIRLAWNGKAQYPKLKCVFKDCPFDYWFKAEDGMPVRKIKYFRSIN
jgi:hypothetical protein